MASIPRAKSVGPDAARLRFGDFEYDPLRRQLRKGGIRVRLQPQSMAILLALMESPGALVTREDLRAHLWGSDTFVQFEHGLNSAIKRLRDALSDSADTPKYVETVAGEGYRFIGPVESSAVLAAPSGEATHVALSPPPIEPRPPRARRWLWNSRSVAVASALCFLLVTAKVSSLMHLPARDQIHSLSVVVSASHDLQSEILAEAAGESVIRTLRRAPNLKVIAEHTIVTPDRGFAAARALGCDAVLLLEGEWRGDRISVRIETIRSRTGERLWEETVTGRVTDAAWVNTNVGEVVVRRLNAGSDYKKQQVVSAAAFQEYVRGRYFWNKRTPSDLQQAFASFRAAIRDDPNFALAYAGLAQTYVVADLHDPAYGGRDETYREARDAAEHAISIDPSLASAHAALAQILRNHDRAMARAEREYLKAIELDGSDATAHQWYAEFLSINGRHDEAIAEIDRAHELDPLSAVITAVCGTIRIQARRYAESLPFAEEGLRLDPHYYTIYVNVAQAMEGQGHYLEAFAALAKEAEVSGDVALAAAAHEDKATYLRGGLRALWRQRLRRIVAQPSLPDQQYELAGLYCRLGEVERCLSFLEQALPERGERVTGIKIDPSFDIIRDDPRYPSLVVRFGFTPSPGQTATARPAD